MAGRTTRAAPPPDREANPTGRPCSVHSRCSRSPQNQREWLAQYPYWAYPARSLRRTVSRDRPHSTGVESTTHTSPVHRLVSRASPWWRPACAAACCTRSGRAGRGTARAGTCGIPQPAGLGHEPWQRLHHRQGEQLSVAELGDDTDCRAPGRPLRELLQQVIGPDVECSGDPTGCPGRRPREPPGSTLGQQRRFWAPIAINATRTPSKHPLE